MKSREWNVDKTNSMTFCFNKTTEMNGSSSVKLPLSSSTIFFIEIDDKKIYFLWAILASLRPCKNKHHGGVSNYRQYCNDLKV